MSRCDVCMRDVDDGVACGDCQYDGSDLESDLRGRLAAMTAARDRLYEIAKGTFALNLMTPDLARETDELRKVGK